jgi:hypothetical protein
MNSSKEFNALRRKMYLTYHRDGILDLVAATVLLGFSTFMATSNVVFLTFGAIVAAQYVMMKRYITIPRMGYVRFVSQDKALKQGWILLGIGVLVLLGFLFLNPILRISGSPEFQAWSQQYHMVPISALLFGLPSLAAAVFLSLKRFYLYALLAAGLPALGAWLNIETFIPILATGLIMLVFGIGLLYSFLRKYPNVDKAGSDVSR